MFFEAELEIFYHSTIPPLPGKKKYKKRHDSLLNTYTSSLFHTDI